MSEVFTLTQVELDRDLHERNLFIVGLVIEVVVVSSCVVLLAIFTAHRTAGCLKLAEGDDTYRLKFRDYDRLDEVEVAFNAMLDKLRADVADARMGAESAGDGTGAAGE